MLIPVAAGEERRIDTFIIDTCIFDLLQRHMISIYINVLFHRQHTL